MLRAERLEGAKRVSIAADKGYDTKDFVREMRGMNATPHVSQNQKRAGGSATDGRTTRHAAIRSANGGRSGLGSIRMGEDDADVAPAWRGRRSVGAVFRGNRGYLRDRMEGPPSRRPSYSLTATSATSPRSTDNPTADSPR